MRGLLISMCLNRAVFRNRLRGKIPLKYCTAHKNTWRISWTLLWRIYDGKASTSPLPAEATGAAEGDDVELPPC